jgi:hypothetical protein
MDTKLTRELLTKLGFRGEGKDYCGRPLYRYEVPYQSKKVKNGYYYDFQMSLNEDVPETNPNSGILSLYRAPITNAHMICEESEKLKIDWVMWETKDQGDGKPSKGGIKYLNEPERIIPIAHHVTTLERLNAIYTSITRNEPLAIREPKPFSKKKAARLKKVIAKSKWRRNESPK